MIRYNLQFFAKEGMGGEKTEPATQKKLEDARKEGQVAKSREIGNGLSMLAVFLILKFWVGHIAVQMLEIFPNVYGRIPDVSVFFRGEMPVSDIRAVFTMMLAQTLIIIAPILIIGFMIAFLSDLVQVKWHPTAKPLQPKMSKLNPLKGFQKIFSTNSLMELVKSIAKIVLIGLISYNYLKDNNMTIFSDPVTYTIPAKCDFTVNPMTQFYDNGSRRDGVTPQTVRNKNEADDSQPLFLLRIRVPQGKKKISRPRREITL